VKNPWDTTKILQKYILVDKTKPQPENLPEGTVVKIPVENIACFYSIDASIIQSLGDEHKIKAIAETQYVKLPFLVAGLKEGKIADIGNSKSLNIERLMDISPDIIIVSSLGSGNLETTGIVIVENMADKEETPLGRAEWIRFIAAFLQKDEEAETIMNDIADRYSQLVEKVKTVDFRPTVFCERKYGQVWWIPGGNSYMAHFLKDAGADYTWKETPETGSLEFSFETIYDKAENADYWLIRSGNDITYQDLKKEFEPYSYFKAWKEKQIILSNTIKNDYYETGMINPDWVLADLIYIFHPELGIQERDGTFFKIMQE
jgi:iron complex transport system substrate-binding protein